MILGGLWTCRWCFVFPFGSCFRPLPFEIAFRRFSGLFLFFLFGIAFIFPSEMVFPSEFALIFFSNCPHPFLFPSPRPPSDCSFSSLLKLPVFAFAFAVFFPFEIASLGSRDRPLAGSTPEWNSRPFCVDFPVPFACVGSIGLAPVISRLHLTLQFDFLPWFFFAASGIPVLVICSWAFAVSCSVHYCTKRRKTNK